jgi:hypothetical protein
LLISRVAGSRISYDLKHDTAQILLKIVSGDEQKHNSRQILLKIVTGDKQKKGEIMYLCQSNNSYRYEKAFFYSLPCPGTSGAGAGV